MSLRLAEAGIFEQRFDARLKVTNPNPIPLPLEGLSYRLVVAGVEIGSGVARPATRIQAFGEAMVDLSLNTGTLGLAQLYQRLRSAPADGIDYRIEGTASMGLLAPDLTFSRTGRVNLGGT